MAQKMELFPKWLYRGPHKKLVKDQNEENYLMKSGGWTESPAKAEAAKKPEDEALPPIEAELKVTEEPDKAAMGKKKK